MLVLSRKSSETIVIDGRITVTVVAINGSTVRIGIEADRNVPVHRGEIHDKIEREGALAEVVARQDAALGVEHLTIQANA